MTNILSRVMTDAHADRSLNSLKFLAYDLCIWLPGISYPWVTLRLTQSCSFSVTEKGHVVLETHTYALWRVVALWISSPDSRIL